MVWGLHYLQSPHGVSECLLRALTLPSLSPTTLTLPSIYRQGRGDLYLDKTQKMQFRKTERERNEICSKNEGEAKRFEQGSVVKRTGTSRYLKKLTVPAFLQYR